MRIYGWGKKMLSNNGMITIALAMYKPNIMWLEEQLRSLDEQDYPFLELIVWNDCPEEDNHEEIFAKCIKKIPYKVYKGEKNLGSNGAFEKLTELAQGDYIAYCDQDDVWKKNKITRLLEEFKSDDKLTLVCSDVKVIDKHSKLVASSIRDVYPRQIPYEGKQLTKVILSRNFVTGCTVLIKTAAAQAALPFPRYTVHDQWLAIWTSMYGKMKFLKETLIWYRLHGENQTSILAGVETKEDYYNKRILKYYLQMEELEKITKGKILHTIIVEKFYEAKVRKGYYEEKGLVNFYKLVRYIYFDLGSLKIFFELLLPIMPRAIFSLIIRNVRLGRI